VFYAIKRIPHYHAIWHVFCIAASAMFCIGFLQHLR
jgi:hemolysin III